MTESGMNAAPQHESKNEQELVKLYMEITGCSESGARSVLMHVEPENNAGNAEYEAPPAPPSRAGRTTAALVLALLCACMSAAGVPARTNSVGSPLRAPFAAKPDLLARPLSLPEAVDIALRNNPAVLRAQKDLEATQGVVIQTRAIAYPKVGLSGNYNAMDKGDIDQSEGFAFGSDQSWRSQVRVVQSIYEGGRIVSSFRIARLTTEQSMLEYQAVLADTIVLVQVAYYDVLLAEQQITVQKASVALLENELANATRRYEVGTVPRFNVLRAEVELANAKPKLIQAQNRFRITKNVLTNLLGFNLAPGVTEDIPLQLSGSLSAEPYEIELSKALQTAFERRPELQSLQKSEAIRKEDVRTAKAGYKPSLQAFAGYDIHSSMFSDTLSDEFHGWMAGVQMNWNIFDGFLTRGRVQQAQALYERAGIEFEELHRRIELDVRTAYSTFIESREVLASTSKVVEQAEEAVRLARARSDAGSGTQLDVLSAQTALTDARTTQVQALRDYEVARVRLERSVGINIPQTAKVK